ncbi:MAG TPA: hypothetical protein VIU62_11325 [Chloroflexota bacterium]|jgi:hypothetical protein
MSYEPSAFDLAAAVVRRSGDPNELLGYLATKFEAALPGQMRVERGGFLGRGPVRLVEVALGDYRYSIETQRNMLQARRAKTVRGVEISHEDLTVDHWVHELTLELQTLAEQSELYGEAIRRLALG